METAQHRNSHLLLLPANRRPRNHPENVRCPAGESMARLGGAIALKSQSFAPISSIVANPRFQNRKMPFCATSTQSSDPMAEEARSKGEGAASRDGNRAEEVETLPPPPERPLPGDCCGSGCVRCVWDIYHDELQAYRDLIEKVKVKPAP